MTTTDNKAPRELPEPEPTSSLEYKMLWHSHKEIQSRLEKCEALLKGIQKGPVIDSLSNKAINQYFAEVER